MNKKKSMVFAFILIFALIPASLFSRTSRGRRQFSDGDNALKRPVVLVLPFINKTKKLEYPNYKHKLVKDIISTFSTSRVKGITKKDLASPELDELENQDVISRLKIASIAYNAEIVLAGQYQIYKDVISKEEKIKVKIIALDAKLGKKLFNLEITGFMKMGYYIFLDRVAIEIENRLSEYSNNADKIIRMFLRGEESPLNKNNTIILEKSVIPLDPTWLVGKGSILAELKTCFTYFNMTFNQYDFGFFTPYQSKLKSYNLSAFIQLQYGLTDSVDIGLKIGFVYYNGRKETTDYWNAQSTELKTSNKMYNPALFIKIKLAKEEYQSFNMSFTLEVAPNLSKNTYSLPFLILRVPVTAGYGKFGFAFSKTLGKVIPYFNLELYVLHFRNTLYTEERQEYLNYTKKKKYSGVYVAQLGALFYVKHNFIIDFKFILRKQSPIKNHITTFSPSYEERVEETDITPQYGFETVFFYKPSSATYFGIGLRYLFKAYFKSYSETIVPSAFSDSRTHTINAMLDIFLIVKIKINLS